MKAASFVVAVVHPYSLVVGPFVPFGVSSVSERSFELVHPFESVAVSSVVGRPFEAEHPFGVVRLN